MAKCPGIHEKASESLPVTFPHFLWYVLFEKSKNNEDNDIEIENCEFKAVPVLLNQN